MIPINDLKARSRPISRVLPPNSSSFITSRRLSTPRTPPLDPLHTVAPRPLTSKVSLITLDNDPDSRSQSEISTDLARLITQFIILHLLHSPNNFTTFNSHPHKTSPLLPPSTTPITQIFTHLHSAHTKFLASLASDLSPTSSFTPYFTPSYTPTLKSRAFLFTLTLCRPLYPHFRSNHVVLGTHREGCVPITTKHRSSDPSCPRERAVLPQRSTFRVRPTPPSPRVRLSPIPMRQAKPNRTSSAHGCCQRTYYTAPIPIGQPHSPLSQIEMPESRIAPTR